MKRRTAGFVACGAGLVALAVPVSSLACVTPDIAIGGGSGGGSSSGGPGDTIGFSISNTERGANYTIDFGGTKLTGTDDTAEPGLQGSIQVPDLGDHASTVSVSASFDHEGATYSSKVSTFSYTGRPQPASPPPASVPQAPPGQSTPATANPGTNPGTAPPVDGGSSAGSGSPATDHGSAQTGSSETAGAGSIHAASGGSGVGIRAEAVKSTESAEPPVAQPDAAATSPGKHAAQRVGEPAMQDATGDSAVERPATPLTAQPASPAQSQDVPGGRVRDVSAAENVSSGALLGVLLAALIALAAMLVLVIRRIGPDETGVGTGEFRWTPPSLSAEARWRGVLIEAELQEMIAEGRARELLGSGTDSEALTPPADRTSGLSPVLAMAQEAPPKPLATHDLEVGNDA